jgi:hypothetical protein
MAKYAFPAILFIFLIVFVGCSSSVDNPITANNPAGQITSAHEINGFTPIIVSDYSADGVPSGGVGILGLYDGILDPTNMTAEITPIRNTAAGLNDSLLVDITTFLTLSPCVNCVVLGSMSINADGRPVLEFGVKHPFAAGDSTKLPSATNRLDLHIFSARGFIVSDGVVGGGYKNFPIFAKSIPAWRLVNASGYAGEFDSNWDTILNTSASLHPYILHFDDYSLGNFAVGSESGFTNIAMPTGNTVMPMGSGYDFKDYVFDFPYDSGQKLKFIYALTASYGLSSTGKSEWLMPRYRLPQYCQKPATLVQVTGIENFLDDAEATSYADLTISVLDINHGAAVGTDIDKMDFDSSVSRIAVEVPDMADSPFEVTDIPSALLGGDGRNPFDPLRFKIRIQNTKLAAEGYHFGLVKIVDSYPTDANQNVSGNAIPSVPPGADLADYMFTVSEWATYSVFTYYVKVGNRRPICDLSLQYDSIFGGTSLTAQPGSGSQDPDGDIVLYEYDMDYDGALFNVNVSNSTGDPVTLGPYPNEGSADYTVTVAMRLTDNGDPAASTICTKELTVQYFSPVVFEEDFETNSNGWTFDDGEFWDIKYGFLGSTAGIGSEELGEGCYCGAEAGDNKYVSSGYIQIPEIPVGFSKLKLTIYHAVSTEIFPHNPYDFTDDCDLWADTASGDPYKLVTSGGMLYNTSSATSKDGPSFAGTIGIIPAAGMGFSGVLSEFQDNRLPGSTVRFMFRQNADDGIENCRGGWWIDWMKLEFLP